MVEKEPLITTIIPTYKRSHLLKKAIQSALAQSFRNIRVSVYDNCSNDETAEIVSELSEKDGRIHYFCHPETIEAAHNFQFALSQVATPYFSILADDDLLLPNFYEEALKTFARYPEAHFCLGSTIDVSNDGMVISANAHLWKGEFFKPPSGVSQVVCHYFNWTGGLFRKTVLEKVSLDPAVKPIDFDFVARLATLFPFALCKKPCAIFFHHSTSYSTLAGLKLIYPSWLKIIENLSGTHSDIKKIMRSILKKRLRNQLIHHLSRNELVKSKEVYEVLTKEFSENAHLKKLVAFVESFPIAAPILRALLTLYSYRRVLIKIRYSRLVRASLKS